MTRQIDLRGRLLSAWVAINIPVLFYFGYESLAMYSCIREIPEHRAFWLEAIHDTEARIEEYRAGLEQGIPKWELPVFIGTPEDEIRDARDGLSGVLETDRMCRARLLSSGASLVGIPLGSLAVILGFLLVVRRFKSEN